MYRQSRDNRPLEVGSQVRSLNLCFGKCGFCIQDLVGKSTVHVDLRETVKKMTQQLDSTFASFFAPSRHTFHNMSQAHLQAFRTESSSTVTSIPTRYDRKTSQHVVRLKDIQNRFEDAQCIMNGEATVLFLTDDDLEE